jgi:hypothetical protein
MDAETHAYITVPRYAMRALPWGRHVRVFAKLGVKHELPATIMNVGWGPSFLVPKHELAAAGLQVNDCITVSLRAR